MPGARAVEGEGGEGGGMGQAGQEEAPWECGPQPHPAEMSASVGLLTEVRAQRSSAPRAGG